MGVKAQTYRLTTDEETSMYNIAYEDNGKVRLYCEENMEMETAHVYLKKFADKYLDANGKGRAYPNGKGYYPISNPRIVRVS